MMDKQQTQEFIAKRVAKEFKDGDLVNLGIGLPTLVAEFIPEGLAVDFQSENGFIGVGPVPAPGKEDPNIVNAGGINCTVLPGGSFFDSSLSFGMGGAMDLLSGARRVIIAMEHTAKGSPKLLKECTLPLSAVQAVDLIVTEMGVIEIRPEGFVLTEYNPEYTLEQIQEATEAKLHLSSALKEMKP